jgi:hypothetical protein
MRVYPQPGFSVAVRTTSFAIAAAVLDRPVGLDWEPSYFLAPDFGTSEAACLE